MLFEVTAILLILEMVKNGIINKEDKVLILTKNSSLVRQWARELDRFTEYFSIWSILQTNVRIILFYYYLATNICTDDFIFTQKWR